MPDIIKIIPLEGIIWNEKHIYLSDTKEAVEAILGVPSSIYENKYYYKSEVRFDFDKDNKIEFIEFLAGINGTLQPEIYEVSAFGTDANVLTKLLEEKNNGDVSDVEDGFSYAFLNTSVGVYRTATPDSVNEMIEDAQDEGEPMDDEDIEYEMQKANHWATIGIGVRDYYR